MFSGIRFRDFLSIKLNRSPDGQKDAALAKASIVNGIDCLPASSLVDPTAVVEGLDGSAEERRTHSSVEGDTRRTDAVAKPNIVLRIKDARQAKHCNTQVMSNHIKAIAVVEGLDGSAEGRRTPLSVEEDARRTPEFSLDPVHGDEDLEKTRLLDPVHGDEDLEDEFSESEDSLDCSQEFQKKGVTLRSQEEIDLKYQKHRDFDGDNDFPRGPWRTQSDALEALKAHTGSVLTGPGAYYLRKAREDRPPPAVKRNRGTVVYLECVHARSHQRDATERVRGSYKCGCGCKVTLEYSTTGYVLQTCNLGHNHAAPKEQLEALSSYPQSRKLPSAAKQYLDKLSDTFTAKQVYSALVDEFRRANGYHSPVPFTESDVYNHLRLSPEAISSDASTVVDFLASMQSEQNLGYERDIDEKGRVEKLFFVLPGARSLWVTNPKLLLADSTHGTNKYMWKLFILSTVNGLGHTCMLACCLIPQETKDTFLWCLEAFKKHLGNHPSQMFTDQDQALEGAITKSFPNCEHKLCIWHISQNVQTHCKRYLGQNWDDFIGAFWKLAQTSDEASKETWRVEYDQWSGMLVSSLGPKEEWTKDAHNAVSWITNLETKKHKWAYRWTWSQFNFGISSTQRCESVHSSLKQFLRSNLTLTQIVQKVHAHAVLLMERSRYKSTKKALRQYLNPNADLMPGLKFVAQSLAPYAWDILAQQVRQMNWYRCTPQGNEVIVKRVQSEPDSALSGIEDVTCDYDFGCDQDTYMEHKVTVNGCSCQFTVAYGLPCRHWLAALSQHHLNLNGQSLISFVSVHWWTKLPEEKRRAMLKDHSEAFQRYYAQEDSKPLPDRDVSQKRFQKMKMSAQLVIETATFSDEYTDWFVKTMEDMHATLQTHALEGKKTKNPLPKVKIVHPVTSGKKRTKRQTAKAINGGRTSKKSKR